MRTLNDWHHDASISEAQHRWKWRALMARVGITDLGIGNFAAMAKMVELLGHDVIRIENPNQLRFASHVIFPGVGAFDYAARRLEEYDWRDPLLSLFSAGKTPVLAVCVGMQLLTESSEEGPGDGLGWIKGECVKFKPVDGSRLKVPHMGWNSVEVNRNSSLFPEVQHENRFYFVHSYYVACEETNDIIATATHGEKFAAVVNRDQVWGVQFHPEKSHRFGLRLLQGFLEVQC